MKSVLTFLAAIVGLASPQLRVAWNGNWAFACDFANNDLSNAKTAASLCGPKCDSTPGCTHFTWTNFEGGTCWMKKGLVSKENAFDTGDQGMVCGIAVNALPTCSNGWTLASSATCYCQQQATAAGTEIFRDEPLSTSQPWASVVHPQPPTNLIAAILKNKPLPTNAWWQNLILANGDNQITTLPYQMKALPDGLHVCHSGKVVQANAIIKPFYDSLVFSAIPSPGNRQVTAFDELSVTMKWDNGGGVSMEAPLVRGMAYVTLIYSNNRPRITSIHAWLKMNGQTVQPGLTMSGDTFEFELNNGQKWVLFLSSPSSITYTGAAMTFNLIFNGAIRAAVATTPEMKTVLNQYRYAIPTGGNVRATSVGNSASLTFNFNKIGQGDLLMMALPHHQALLNPTMLRQQVQLDCLKGIMVGAVGSSWTMVEPLTTITWGAPRPIAGDKVEAVRAALKGDVGKSVVASDTYFGGKQMAAIARLALIADELGETALASNYRAKLKGYLEPWLKSGSKLVYDQTWGGVIDPNGSFGMNKYNDHHYHYGYFIYAAAVIAKADPGWVNTYGSFVMTLIRDFSNPATNSGDPYFTQMRSKDWFVGHSWAAGLDAFADSRNQESTSEAVNAWYAIALYGLAINNNRLKDLGRLALATEIRSAQYYWQIKSTSTIYPTPFASNKVVGIIWETKADYGTWFGSNKEFIHCIQMLPFVPITEELLPKDWITEEYPVLSPAASSAEQGWKGFIYMAHAIIDKNSAWNEVNGLTSFDDGNTKTNTLYWVATRP